MGVKSWLCFCFGFSHVILLHVINTVPFLLNSLSSFFELLMPPLFFIQSEPLCLWRGYVIYYPCSLFEMLKLASPSYWKLQSLVMPCNLFIYLLFYSHHLIPISVVFPVYQHQHDFLQWLCLQTQYLRLMWHPFDSVWIEMLLLSDNLLIFLVLVFELFKTDLLLSRAYCYETDTYKMAWSVW